MMTDGGAFYQLQEEFRGAFECTVIDIPRGMLIQHPHLMNDANVVVLATEMTLAAARDSIRLLSWLKSNAPQARADRRGPTGCRRTRWEISRKDFESSIERKLDLLIPVRCQARRPIGQAGQDICRGRQGHKARAQPCRR